MEDVWVLVGSIRNKKAVPRVLLKNGKRSSQEDGDEEWREGSEFLGGS